MHAAPGARIEVHGGLAVVVAEGRHVGKMGVPINNVLHMLSGSNLADGLARHLAVEAVLHVLVELGESAITAFGNKLLFR
jgi:hypothetical protein